MKRFVTIASAALLAMSGLLGTACSTKANAVENESSPVKKTFNVTGFTEVDAGNQFEVDIKTGGKFAVTVDAPGDLFQYITISRKGEKLAVNWNEKYNSFFSRRSNNHARVKITVSMPVLNKVSAHGQSSFDISGTSFGKRLVFDVSGQSEVKVNDNFNTGQLTIDLSGQSSFRCNDAVAKNVAIDCSGQTGAHLGFLTATAVNLDTSGQAGISIASCKANAISADASGQSRISAGRTDCPSVSRSTSGQASINL